MTNNKYKFEQELIDLITPHVLQPEQEKAKLIIIEILNKIKDEFSYGCIDCLNGMDEFYGRMYGAERINTDYIESVISNLEIM